MNFRESEAYLLSLGNEVAAMKLGLENISILLKALGDPQNDYKKVQIAGTNGKGSVCAFLNSICLQADIRTGSYTSPHLVSITERVKIDGTDISEENFARFATRVRETSEELVSKGELENVPTFFEQVTAIALLAFAEAGAELAILETGLGGRLDATTAANSEIVGITRIDLDHQEYLGDTIEKIAAEKAAIIRSGVRAVIGPQIKAAERVIAGRCREVGVDPIRAGGEYVIKSEPGIAPWLFGTFVTDKDNYTNVVLLGMLGRHQFENALIAIYLAECVRELGFDVSKYAIIHGLETAVHPGRLEYIGDVLLDGAHNPGGAKALAAYLDEFETRPVTMIYGTMRDKDIGEITKILFPKAATLILTTPQNSRAVPAAELSGSAGVERVHITPNAEEALELARKLAGEGVIVVTGSLYLVGEARSLINKTLDNA